MESLLCSGEAHLWLVIKEAEDPSSLSREETRALGLSLCSLESPPGHLTVLQQQNKKPQLSHL